MSKLSRQPLAAMPSMFTVDVEDWFHILELPATPKLAEWDALPSRVERNFHVLLDLFAETGTKVTCFFLGYVAQRFPHLVREAAGAGHEIASHGYVLTPGRYVGAEEVEDDGEPFEEKMTRLVKELDVQFLESAKLELQIRDNLKGLGYAL